MHPNSTSNLENKISKPRLIAEFLFFIFLLCMGNPVNYFSESKIMSVIFAWIIIFARYSLSDLFKAIKPWRYSIIWAYYLLLILTGCLTYFNIKPNILRPANYSVYDYCYGVETIPGEPGRTPDEIHIGHLIEKGPYNIKETKDYDGSDEVPDEVKGMKLDDVMRRDFFFLNSYDSSNIFYFPLETLIRCNIPDFILLCFMIAIFIKTSEESRFFVVNFSRNLVKYTSRNLLVLTKWMLRRIFLNLLKLFILAFVFRIFVEIFSYWNIIIMPVIFVSVIILRFIIRNIRRSKSFRKKGYHIESIFTGGYRYCEPSKTGFQSKFIPTEYTLSGNKKLVIPSKNEWVFECSRNSSNSWAAHRRDEIFSNIINFWGRRKIEYPDDWPNQSVGQGSSINDSE